MTDDISTYNQLIDIILTEDDTAVSDFILLESDKDEVMAGLDGDTTLMNYLFLFEAFLDQHDIYLFDGWEDAQIIGQPVIEKFWITIRVLVDDNVDLRGASRVNDAMQQGEVRVKKLSSGQTMVTFMILKRQLDQIETLDKEKIEKLSDKALEGL